MDDQGQVVAEAELAWEDERVAVLLLDQEDSAFNEASWRTFPADEPELATRIVATLKESEL